MVSNALYVEITKPVFDCFSDVQVDELTIKALNQSGSSSTSSISVRYVVVAALLVVFL